MLRKRRHHNKENSINYLNPRKSAKFSPSPIKRYMNQRQMSLSQATIVQLPSDDKENQPFNTILSQLMPRKRGRKPLQQLQQQQNNLNIEKYGNFKLRENKQQELAKKTSILPLQIVIENQKKKQESQISSKMNNQQHKDVLVSQVNDSQKQMIFEEENKEFGNQAQQLQSIQDQGMHQEDLIRSSRSLGSRMTLQIQNLDNQSDSLMEATHNSMSSQGPQGMQYSGRWTTEEHEKFLEGLKLFGKDWRQIEEHIGSRTCAQIRSHAQKYFNKLHRDQAKALGTYQKGTLGKRKREEQKRTSPIAPNVVSPKPNAIEDRTKQQVAQIHETLMKLAEDDMVITLRSLITQREQVCFEFIMKKIDSEEACKLLINITNLFHQAVMRALQSNRFELCNRMVDERNLSQFICILLSKQITVLPDTSASNQEIIQHVHTMSMNSQDSLQTHLGGLMGVGGDSHESMVSKLVSPSHEKMLRTKLDHDPNSAFHIVEKGNIEERI